MFGMHAKIYRANVKKKKKKGVVPESVDNEEEAVICAV
jgi:hypothetical protein